MRRSTALLVAAVCVAMLGAAAMAHGQSLPMPTGPTGPAAGPAVEPSMPGSLLAWANHVQGELWRGLAKAVRAVKDEGSLAALAWLMGLGFSYGVLHAAGPGHGKAVISAYLVGNESAVRRGIVLSFLSAAAQGVTAIVAVGVLAALMGFFSRDVASVTAWLEMASYAMIAALGLYLVVQTLRSILGGRDLHDHAHHGHGIGHGHDHDHAHAHTHVAPQAVTSWRGGLAIVAAVGLRPCMGSVFVLLFALAQGVFFSGVLATAAISLGTAITVAVLAIMASGTRRLALALARGMDGWFLRVYWGLSLLGGGLLLAMGIALLVAPPTPPFPGAG